MKFAFADRERYLADPAFAQSIADFRKGKDAAIKRLLGGVMRATGGKANPQLAEQILRDLLRMAD